MDLLGLLAVPLVVAAIAALCFKATITLKEVFLQFIGVSLIIVMGYFIARYCGLRDIEHWNGRITRKDHGTQKCCHCHDECDSRDKKGSCTSSHQVCAHFYDYWWSLRTTVGTISVENCAGWDFAPALWNAARVGEPATIENAYTNYLRANSESLFVHAVKSPYAERIPPYPIVHGLYKVEPVISDGPAFPAAWQDAFREINADYGASKQVDVAVLVTGVSDPVYAQAVESKWLYGPKNSMTVVLGVGEGRISWARVVSISKIEELKIFLRDELAGKPLSADIPGIVRNAVRTKFERTPMAEFEYLASTAAPSMGWLVFLYVIGVLLSGGCSIYLHRVDVFGDEDRFGSRDNPFKRSYYR